MRRPRGYIPYADRLAAALSRLLPAEQEKELRERAVPAKAVIALFHMDHVILHALGGSDAWHNLDPKLVAPHKEKSRADTSIVAKVRRIDKEPEKWRGLTGPKQEKVLPAKRSRHLRSANRWPPRGSRKIENRKAT